MSKKFKVQIPTKIVRSNSLTAIEFVLLAKLIQAYYIPTKKSLTIPIDHKAIMYFLLIKDQATLKKHLKTLFEKGIIENEIETLPRKGALEINLNKNVIPELNKEGLFTQMPVTVLNREIIEAVGHVGVRMLYYYKSFINLKQPTKQFCFVSEETTSEDLGITEKTVIKYNKILEKRKFIKIEKHKSQNEYNYQDRYVYYRYNNHYFIRQDKIDEFCEKSTSLLA